MTAPVSHTPGIVKRLRDWPAGGQHMLSSTVVGNLTTEAAYTIQELMACLETIAVFPLPHYETDEEKLSAALLFIDVARNSARIAIASATGIPS